MPVALSGRTSAHATRKPSASAWTMAFEARSVRYSGWAWASATLTMRSSAPASRSHPSRSSADEGQRGGAVHGR